MRRGAAAAVLVAALAAACGTTVPQGQLARGGSTEAGLGGGGQAPGQGGSGSLAQLPGRTASSAGSSSPAGGSTTGGAGQVGGSGTTGGGGVPVLTGRGVTAKTITLGVAIAGGTQSLANSFGVAGAGALGTEDMLKAVVNDVNRSGGVLGRTLQLYVHNFDATAAISNPAATFAQICADFRDDHKVFAVIFDIPDPSLRACLAKMGTPLVVLEGFAILPSAAYAENGGNYLYGPDAITTERLARLFITSLLDRSFTRSWNTRAGGPGVEPAKLGLIHVDTPDQNALYAAYAKELARHGLRFTDTVTYPQDAGAALAATQSAVLKFRADGITHVFGASAFFLRDAENQGYRPRYAYLPGLGALGVSNSPANQLKGALTVGWSPSSDVQAAQDPGGPVGSARCARVMKAAGLSPGDNRTDLTTEYAGCDAVYVLQAALTAGRVPDVAGLRRGYEALGTGFPTALTFSARLDGAHHDGVSSVRDMAFDSGCGCLVYTSRTNRS